MPPGRRRAARVGPFRRRRGATVLVAIEDVTGLHQSTAGQRAAMLLETYDDLKSADLADVIHDLSPKRRAEVAAALDDEQARRRPGGAARGRPGRDPRRARRAERAADVLEAMEPDDAADLLPS